LKLFLSAARRNSPACTQRSPGRSGASASSPLSRGEAGIGKTTLVDCFLAQARASGHVWIGRGQCIEQQGPGEAYLPVLEALGQLCRERHGEQVIAVLRRYAPMWLVQ